MSRSKAHGRNIRAHVDKPIEREIRQPTAAERAHAEASAAADDAAKKALAAQEQTGGS